MTLRPCRLLWFAWLPLVACGDASDVRVQPLPSLRTVSPEQRAGLPRVNGLWRFAGVEVADSSGLLLGDTIVGAGDLQIATQRLDSLAGVYAIGRGRFPFAGEVRRDGVVSLVVFGGGGERRVLAGQLERDTLWVSTTTLPVAEIWPGGARGAWVRRRGLAPAFVRLNAVVQAAADSVARMRADSARSDSIARGLIDPSAPPQVQPPVQSPLQPPARAPSPSAVSPGAARPVRPLGPGAPSGAATGQPRPAPALPAPPQAAPGTIPPRVDTLSGRPPLPVPPNP